MKWNQHVIKAKHEIRKTLFFASHALHVNGWRIITLGLLGLIIMRKDISLNLNLKSPTQYEQNIQNVIPVNENAELTKNVVTNEVSNSPKKTLPAPKPAKNTVKQTKSKNTSQFPNIAFVLNPTYAKRNNINPTIVAQKNIICTDYIKRFSLVAVKEMKKYGKQKYACALGRHFAVCYKIIILIVEDVENKYEIIRMGCDKAAVLRKRGG